MIYEHAVAADAGALTELRLAYLAEDLGEMPEAEVVALRRQLPGYFRKSLGKSLFGYVAREGGEIAACALMLIMEKPMSPAFSNGRTGMVLNVYTRPAFRRQGHARRLMGLMLADARALELSAVDLKATEAGEPLYRSLGFADSGQKYKNLTWRPQRR